jgi:hypothetical protein
MDEIFLTFPKSGQDMTNALDSRELERIARKRVAAKMGWLAHAGVYLAVNAFLVAVSVFSGKGWTAFPLVGWGDQRSFWYEKLLQAERSRLQVTRDPW